MKFTRRTGIAAVVGIVVLSGPLALAADWPNWRGPNHDGISPEKGFKTEWKEPPKVLWEAPIGSAFSSVTCVGDKVYTCGTKDKKQVLFCLNANTGEEIWKKPFEKERKDGQGGDGTRATPTIDDGRVYILGGHGLLVCFDAKSGDEIWNRQLKHEPQWGYAGSVLIEGDMAIVCGGESDGGLLALDKKTGKEIWKCTEEPAGYSTPYPITFHGKRYIVGFLAKLVVVAEAKTGREVWRAPWETSYDVNAPTPIFHDGYLFLVSGYSTGCGVFKLAPDGDKLSGEKVWGISKVIMSKIQSCVLKDGVLYGSDQNRSLKCVELVTGKELWNVEGYANATVILADGHLIVLTERGKLEIAKASPKEYKPTAEATILKGGPKGNQCWTIPTLYNGKLYARNLAKAVCVDLSAGK
jgi:outer membrane protein assembly factor BamB